MKQYVTTLLGSLFAELISDKQLTLFKNYCIAVQTAFNKSTNAKQQRSYSPSSMTRNELKQARKLSTIASVLRIAQTHTCETTESKQQ